MSRRRLTKSRANGEANGAAKRAGRSAASPPRCPDPESLDPASGRHRVKVDARGRDRIAFGREEIDLRAVEQILDASQTRAIALALAVARERFMGPETSLEACLDRLEALIDRDGLEALDPFGARGEHPGSLARPRRLEIAAAINRFRDLRLL